MIQLAVFISSYCRCLSCFPGALVLVGSNRFCFVCCFDGYCQACNHLFGEKGFFLFFFYLFLFYIFYFAVACVDPIPTEYVNWFKAPRRQNDSIPPKPRTTARFSNEIVPRRFLCCRSSLYACGFICGVCYVLFVCYVSDSVNSLVFSLILLCTVCVGLFVPPLGGLVSVSIVTLSKHCLFKYIENFTTKKANLSDKKF